MCEKLHLANDFNIDASWNSILGTFHNVAQCFGILAISSCMYFQSSERVWTIDINLAFEVAPQKEIWRCQIGRLRWPGDIAKFRYKESRKYLTQRSDCDRRCITFCWIYRPSTLSSCTCDTKKSLSIGLQRTTLMKTVLSSLSSKKYCPMIFSEQISHQTVTFWSNWICVDN